LKTHFVIQQPAFAPDAAAEAGLLRRSHQAGWKKDAGRRATKNLPFRLS